MGIIILITETWHKAKYCKMLKMVKMVCLVQINELSLAHVLQRRITNGSFKFILGCC